MNIMFLLKPKKSVSYLYDDYTLKQGLEKMHRDGYTASPVISHEGYYVGTVNEGDFLWHILGKDEDGLGWLKKEHVQDIVRENWNQPVTISATVEDLVERVLNQNFVPVVDDRNLFVGIITRKDVIQHFGDRIKELKGRVNRQDETTS